MYYTTTKASPVYINADEFESRSKMKGLAGRPKNTAYMFFKKHRGTCLQGVYKNTKGIHVTLTSDYLSKLKELGKADSSKRNGITVDIVIKDLFKDLDDFAAKSELSYEPITTIENNTKYSSGWEEDCMHNFNADSFEFDIYFLKDFELLPKTKKEQEAIAAKEHSKHIETVNMVCLKDTVFAALEQNGIKLTTRKDWHYEDKVMAVPIDKKEYNKLVLTAVNNYLNQIGKQYGFRIKQPKIKANARLSEYTPIFFIQDIEMLNNEQ